MNVEIYPKHILEIILEHNFPDNTAVISFYDPDISGINKNKSRIDFSHKSIRVFTVALYDIDVAVLPAYGLTYETYFPEAEALAEFIYSAYNDGLDIICQSAYCEGRSAACAAAILEHFSHEGISVFSESYRYPNPMVFHKILDALEQFASGDPIMVEKNEEPLPTDAICDEKSIVSHMQDILVLTDDYCFPFGKFGISMGIIAYVDLTTNELREPPNSFLLFDNFTKNFHSSDKIETKCIYHLKAYLEKLYNRGYPDFMVAEIIEKNTSNAVLEQVLKKYNKSFKIMDDVVGNIILSRCHRGYKGTFDYFGQQVELTIDKVDFWEEKIDKERWKILHKLLNYWEHMRKHMPYNINNRMSLHSLSITRLTIFEHYITIRFHTSAEQWIDIPFGICSYDDNGMRPELHLETRDFFKFLDVLKILENNAITLVDNH